MKNFFKTIHQDSVLGISFWTTLATILIMLVTIAGMYTNLPPFVPLYNHMPWGYARLGHSFELFILPLLILVFTIANVTIGLKLVGRIPLLARFLFLTVMCLGFFTLIFVLRLILTVL